MRRSVVVALLALTGVMALGSGSASAAPSDAFVYKYSFDGSALPNPIAGASRMVVNHATGNLLVLGGGYVSQFDPAGNPVNFSGTGSPQIAVPGSNVLDIDNSGGPNQGAFYMFAAGDNYTYYAFHADGTPFAGSPFQPSVENKIPGNASMCGGGVGPDGNVWVTVGPSLTAVHSYEFTPAGQPTGRTVTFSAGPPVCPTVFDSEGFIYIPEYGGEIHKYGPESNPLDLGYTGLRVYIDSPVTLAVDPSTDDIYDVKKVGIFDKASIIVGVHRSDPLVEADPFVAIDLIAASTFAFDATGQTIYLAEGSKFDVFHREPLSPPHGLTPLRVEEVRSRGAELRSELVAGGAQTSYRYEYGLDTGYGSSTAPIEAKFSHFSTEVSGTLSDLQPGTTYHVRMSATNSAGTTYGPDKTFKTYPAPLGGGADPCPNALARKQTIAQRLPDCRAYELASAGDTGGYDVESYLTLGQNPFAGYPLATDKLLYATHAGAVPGPWNATNKGPDPYLATRTASGWTTEYKGLPADLNPAAGSFSSVLGEADSSLDTLAFAGPGLCSPCFISGLETGIPLRMPNGQLVQGMAGSLDPGVATAKPEGKVAKYFSKDGKHLVFASKYAFETGANNNGSDLTVYDRNLAGTTQVVSTAPAGAALSGAGISELDISDDGSRIVIGKEVSSDSQGNEYVHPYLHLGSSPNSVDLAPGTTSGVLFAGMSEDGSKLFFITADKLLGSDTDSSADLYEADVDGSGNLSLSQVTEPSSNACNPVANSNGEHWNTTGATADCGAVAISGGGGIASGTGAIYFLSPEQLDGTKGTMNQPNLYLAEPGQPPTFIATLEPNNALVLDSVKAAAVRKSGEFQTTPSGNFAAFTSALPLTGVGNFGLRSVFRYGASSGQLTCPSCDTTETADDSFADNAELAPNGLSLLEDGRVFFTTRFPLVLNDANGRKDVYQWSDGVGQQLISAGTGPFDSALLSASADGKDVFFFTHDSLAPEEDHNGQLMKIYDAREGGGFFKLPQSVPCQASDECHGPGTVTPVPPDIRSAGKTTVGNVVTCAKNRVKRGGKCVKKAHAKKNKKRAAKTNRKRGGRNA